MIKSLILVTALGLQIPGQEKPTEIGQLVRMSIDTVVQLAGPQMWEGRKFDTPRKVWLDRISFREELSQTGADSELIQEIGPTTKAAEVSELGAVLKCTTATPDSPSECEIKDGGIFVRIESIDFHGPRNAEVVVEFREPTPGSPGSPACPKYVKIFFEKGPTAARGEKNDWIVKEIRRGGIC